MLWSYLRFVTWAEARLFLSYAFVFGLDSLGHGSGMATYFAIRQLGILMQSCKDVENV
jgi:hypothetical protein